MNRRGDRRFSHGSDQQPDTCLAGYGLLNMERFWGTAKVLENRECEWHSKLSAVAFNSNFGARHGEIQAHFFKKLLLYLYITLA